MRYRDAVYGEQTINETVLIELIEHPMLQRLKGIDQGAYRKPFFPGNPPSRFDHSVGVMLLLKKYGAPLEEQVAGLIHDVSHSAFSHGIDYILKRGTEKTQAHQDNIHHDFIKRSGIPTILSRHGCDLAYILDDSHFPLKETNIPDICADRLDYTLRDAVSYGELTPMLVQQYLRHLTTVGGKWVFTDFEFARKFAELFHMLNEDYWSGIRSATMFQTVGDYVGYALERSYVTEKDLYSTDQEIFDKIAPHHPHDKQAKLYWDRMNCVIKYTSSNESDNDAHIFLKSRAVDPLCRHQGKIQRVSDIDPRWKKTVTKALKPKEYYIKFEK